VNSDAGVVGSIADGLRFQTSVQSAATAGNVGNLFQYKIDTP